MPTSTSSVASLTAPPTFTGVSKFGASLQQVLTRAVGIASLPLDSLKAGLTDLNAKQSALQSLDSTFLTLQESISSLQFTLTNNLLTASVSGPGVASANLQPGAAAGTYSIEVQSLGAYSTAISNPGAAAVKNPATQGITNSSTVTLSVGGIDTLITPASDNLSDLASAINSQTHGQVYAGIVNIGPTASPDYRLSLVATNLGPDEIALTDSSGASLIANGTAGALASYVVGGSSGSITSTTRTITLSPGLTVNLLSQSTAGQPTAITVANDAAGLASAFRSFANAYNSAAAALRQQHGQNAGALQGDGLLQTLSGVLSQLSTYSGGSASSALANFGITVDQNGQLSVDTIAFTNSANADFHALLATLGASDSGGFLKKATDLLGNIENATGLVPAAENDLARRISDQQTKVSNEQATVAQLQANLTKQIAQADAAIAALESQVSYVTGLFGQYTGATNTQANGLSTL
jgi:flagellar hook-associated protein 2